MKYEVRRILALMLIGLFISGCSTINQLKFWQDDTKKVPPLPALQEKISVQSKWNQKVGKGSRGQYLALTPIIENEVIYATDAKGVVEAINLHTNKTQWKTTLKEPVTAGVGVGQELVLVGTRKGRVIALAQDSGKELWRADVDGEILSSPLATAKSVIVQTSNNHVFGLDPKTGVELWMFEAQSPALTLRTNTHPLVTENIGIIGQPNGRLVAFDIKNGDRKWEQTLMVGRGRSELQRMVDINGDLAVANGILYAASYQGRIGAFELTSGRPYWQRDMSSSTGVELVNDNALAVSDSEGIVWLLDSDTGAILWKQEALKERQLTRPTLVGETLVVSDQQGFVHILALEDGKLIGREKLGKKPIYTPAIPGDKESQFFILDSAGKLKAFEMG